MKNSIVRNILSAVILCITLAVAPQSVLAQRGGHGGGGGGFHGGGGSAGGGYHGGGGYAGGGYHGGGGYAGGGYHGGGYGGWHGGYGGWHGGYGGYGGGYWGYPGYAWGVGISFGWGSWGYDYPYGYGYGQAWAPPYYPYCYSYSYPYCYSYAPTGYIASNAEPENSSSAYVGASYTTSRANAPAPRNTTVTTSGTIKYAAYHPPASPVTGAASAAGPQLSSVRPEVQNVIRALRGMPPAAREREIDSGRYGNLSPQELKFVKYAADLPPA